MTQPSLRDELLSLGFKRDLTTFAGGQVANNKLNLDFDSLQQDQDIFWKVVDRLVQQTSAYGPDFVIGVPNGATRLAEAVAKEIDAYNPWLTKTEDGSVAFSTVVDAEMVSQLHVGVMVEDVINRRTSTDRVMKVHGLGHKIVAVVAVFDRGDPGDEAIDIAVPVHSLAQQTIPAMLPETDPLWRFAS